MSDHIGLIRFTGVDGQSRQVSGYLHDLNFGADGDDELAFTLQPLTETVTIHFDGSQFSEALALLFGELEQTEPPFPDPDDHLEDDPRD